MYQNNSKQSRTEIDSQSVLKEAFLDKEKAIKVVQSNKLVPHEFRKVDLTYNSDNNVETATYWDLGTKQVSSFIPRVEGLSTPETSIVNLKGAVGAEIVGKGFTTYDNSDKVAVVFRLAGEAVTPLISGDRFLYVDLAANDTEKAIANKTAHVLTLDNYYAISEGYVVTFTPKTNGNRLNTKSKWFPVKSIDGTDALPLNNSFFKVFLPNGTFEDFWFNVDGLGIAPNPPSTGESHEININSNFNLRQVINAIKSTVNASVNFTCYTDPNSQKVVIVCDRPGPTLDIEDLCGFSFVRTETVGVESKIITKIFISYNMNGDVVSVESV
jgi:hypothetical protein